ncbi:aspartate carbamoyltransferase catalytic subunit [Mesoterricola sediminis]|uniref:Aspartate carbamoyltransferase n=1 Tax=Mesoterricola sediminis TaxID=2927980 RepID=A0AA48KER0_9BACT|nr:aspartate carbamoyltransferase catalytic subunit [Mesoterricola sediminis]BDU78320.1 aspartate carbamoyltransferase [Mesoterricola sediminis]
MPQNRYVFPHRHLLGIEPLSPEDITHILDQARAFEEVCERPEIKIVPALRKRLIVNLFFENSTRTRNSFEIAEKRLSAEIINFDADTSSLSKGETLIDTALNLEAMHPDLIVMRHSAPGAHALLARHMKASIVNAGDGAHEHPTQALLDAYTLRKRFGKLEGLRIAIVGDIRNSRVVRSNLWLLTKMGAHVTLVGPPTLVPRELKATWPDIEITHDLDAALPSQDAVMMLRCQFERGTGAFIPGQGEYVRFFQLNARRMGLARPDVAVLHPGPINRGVEITSEVADGPNNLILDQVTNGVPVRMAVLYLLCNPHGEQVP